MSNSNSLSVFTASVRKHVLVRMQVGNGLMTWLGRALTELQRAGTIVSGAICAATGGQLRSIFNHRRIGKVLLLMSCIVLTQPQMAHAVLRGSNAQEADGQVKIYIQVGSSQGFNCTGTLISSTWVLTAAHCIPNQLAPSKIIVLAGGLGLLSGVTYYTAGYFRNLGSDAALIQLANPVSVTTMRPWGYGVGLLDTESLDTTTVRIQGWGATTQPPQSPSPDLKTAIMKAEGDNEDGTMEFSEQDGLPTNGDSGAGVLYGGIVCGVESRSALVLHTATATTTDSLASWISSTTGVQPAGICAPPQQSKKRACDYFIAKGTECAAAYSTVRSLVGHYAGKLYQVQRRSDGATIDIPLQSLGNADASVQDQFCANTTCNITKIYDQTYYHNDLSIAGGGEEKPSADTGAVADALPITVNGNKVYGVSVTPGVGYRNNNTTGIARNLSDNSVPAPEGMYMVTSGRNVNNACCFDFGNAEADSRDNGNGHMDALNFGTFCEFGPCSGSGPWVEADLENGQYMGGGSNPANPSSPSFPYDFVTAMSTNDSQTTFSLSGGNAQSGSLFSLYNGSLPTKSPGYTPMTLEGGITLGTGGDNSAGGVGSFFEGAMVLGVPTAAAQAAVQADIIAAGYGGNSVSTNGEKPTYTGPSDPNGPGPQDGYNGPAVEQTADLMGSKPGMAYFNQKIYAAFQADDSSHKLFVTATTNGTPYPTATGYPDIHIGSAPALAVFRHQLYVGFQADDSSHFLYVSSSPSGSDFPTATGYGNIRMGSAPGMTEYNSDLYVAFQADDESHVLFVTHSQDGKTFPAATAVPNVKIGGAPALAVYRSDLYVAFRADDNSNDVWIARSIDGVHFDSKRIAGFTNAQTMGPNSSPALVVSNGILYCIYGADDLADEMLVMATSDGSNWQGPKAYLSVQMGASGPGATVTNSGVTVGFQSNDSRDVMYTTYKMTEPGKYSGADDPTGTGPQDYFSSPANPQSEDVLGSRPGLAAFSGRVYAGFQANDGSDALFVTSSTPSSPFPKATGYSNITIGGTPALAAYNGQLYVAFQANDDSHALFMTASSTGSAFPKAKAVGNIKIGGSPSLAVYNDRLYVAFQANDDSHVLFIASMQNGIWTTARAITNVKIGSDPSLTVFHNQLFIAFKADDTSNDVWIASSSDGQNFSSHVIPGQHMGWNSTPSLVEYGGYLLCLFRADDAANETLVVSSSDGESWMGPKVYSNLQTSDAGPSATVLNGLAGGPYYGAVAAFQSFDASSIMFATTDTSAN